MIGVGLWALYGPNHGFAKADDVFPTFILEYMPHGLLGLCIAALIAALIDTVSSALNSFSTVFTLDLVGQFKEMTEVRKLKLVSNAEQWYAWKKEALGEDIPDEHLSPVHLQALVGRIEQARQRKTA